jgi:hypothetical protein
MVFNADRRWVDRSFGSVAFLRTVCSLLFDGLLLRAAAFAAALSRPGPAMPRPNFTRNTAPHASHTVALPFLYYVQAGAVVGGRMDILPVDVLDVVAWLVVNSMENALVLAWTCTAGARPRGTWRLSAAVPALHAAAAK